MLHRARAALARIRGILRRRSRVTAEQDEEFAFHIEMETSENIRRGMNPAEARRVALVRFGGTLRFGEETSEARAVVALDNLARDARFAVRRLKRAPGFSAGVIATLGIGIGAAVGIGTIVYDVLVRDLPYDRPDQLVRVEFVAEGLSTAGDLLSPAAYFHFAKSARAFTGLGASSTSDVFTITDGDVPQRVTVAMMTPSVFTLLGVRPILGQLFETRDTSWTDGSGRIPILISENLWRRRYGADSSIIGRRVEINRGERVVIGVLPRSFDFPAPSVDLFYPATVPVNRPQLAPGYFTVIGRLRDGIDASRAEVELNDLLPRITERFPAITRDMLQRARARISVTPLKAATVAPVRAQLVLLGVLVAIVLLIATANSVNLFLLRTERASQEIAVALSLGATRAALAQRFVMEGIVLALASTVVAFPAAALALATKFGFTDREIPRLDEVGYTAQTIALVLGCAVVIGALLGLVALTRTRMVDVFDRLRTVQPGSSLAWRRVRDGLVAFQVAIALMLLVAAGLLGRSFLNLRNARIGFEPANAMTFQVSLPWNGYTSYGEQAVFHAKLTDRLAALPGANSVGIALYLPLESRGAPVLEAQLQAGDGDGRPVVAAAGNMASTDYFRAMGIPVRAGRSFRSGDLRGAPAVVLSERLAISLFGTTDVVGRRVTGRVYAGARLTAFTVVGVVGDVNWGRIEAGYVPMVYFPLLRDGDGLPADSNPVRHRPSEVQYVVRGTQLPSPATILEVVRTLDRRVPAANVRSLGSVVGQATARVRLTMLLIAIAGIAALLLGVIGVYSVVAYAANGRAREFGIRLALGAAPARIGGMVLGDGLRLVGIGTFAGLAAALGATRFLRALLYEVKPTSVAEFAMPTVLLVVVTLVATLIPAFRAAHTPSVMVLRGEQ